MKTQIKQWADSKVIVLSKEFLKLKNLNVGDWIDLEDITKVKVLTSNKDIKKEVSK